MKKYEAYKDSGIEWIGEIPEGWEISRIKYLLEQSKDGIKIGPFGSTLTGKVDNEGEYKVYGQWNIVGKDFNAGKNFVSAETFDALEPYHISSGDLFISMMGTVGKCAIIPEGVAPGIMDSHVVKARLDKTKMLSKFFEYVYDKDNSNVIYSQIQKYRKGSIMDGLNSTLIKEFFVPCPPLVEQQAIVSYLDYKVGQIDASISAINSQIDDLKAYRQSIISEAVTKGLNPDVKMKDSGVEWFGEIPETWKFIILKRVAKVLTGTTPSTAEENYWNNPDYTWYTPADIKDDSIELEDSERKVNSFAVTDGAIKEFPKGSLLMVGIGSIGKVGITEKPCSANQQINAIVFDNNVNPKFGAYFIFASRDNIRSKANAALLPIINQTAMGNIEFLLPSINEQNSIVHYLDNKTSKIASAIKSLEAYRDELNALKQSIISEAVTGKIDLREWKQSVEQ